MSIGFSCGSNLKDIKDSLGSFDKECAQIFCYGPRGYNPIKMDIDGVKKLTSSGKRVYVHQSYLTSWKDDKKSINHITDQLKRCIELGASGFVMHLPKLPISDIIDAINKWYSTDMGITLLLEMRAIKAPYNYHSPEEINNLCETLMNNDYTPDDVSICIDTAHIGVSVDINNDVKATEYLENLAYPSYIGLLHLNGNSVDVSKKAGDKHCIPNSKEDNVFHSRPFRKSGCVTFINWFKNNGKDIILETLKPKIGLTIQDSVKFYKKYKAL
jgi:endonuclease IV